MISIISLRFLAIGPTPFCWNRFIQNLNTYTGEAYPANALALTGSIFRVEKGWC